MAEMSQNLAEPVLQMDITEVSLDQVCSVPTHTVVQVDETHAVRVQV